MMNYANTEAFSNAISFQHNVKCRIGGELVKPVKYGVVNRPIDVIASQPDGTCMTIDVCFTGTNRVLGEVVITKIGSDSFEINSYSERFAEYIPENQKAGATMVEAAQEKSVMNHRATVKFASELLFDHSVDLKDEQGNQISHFRLSENSVSFANIIFEHKKVIAKVYYGNSDWYYGDIVFEKMNSLHSPIVKITECGRRLEHLIPKD